MMGEFRNKLAQGDKLPRPRATVMALHIELVARRRDPERVRSQPASMSVAICCIYLARAAARLCSSLTCARAARAAESSIARQQLPLL